MSTPAQATPSTIDFNITVLEPDGSPASNAEVDLWAFSSATTQWQDVTTAATGDDGTLNPADGTDNTFTLTTGTEYAVDVTPAGDDTTASGGWLVGDSGATIDPDFVQTGSNSTPQTWFTAGSSDMDNTTSLAVGGTLSGSLANSDSSPAVANNVYALRDTTAIDGTTSYQEAGVMTLSSDGASYVATQLPSGNYKFEATQTTDTSELGQVYNGGVYSEDDASAVPFDATTSTPTTQDLTFEAGGLITGATNLNGSPSDFGTDLTVFAYPVDSSGNVEPNGTRFDGAGDGSDGSYSLRVAPGNYLLDFSWTGQPTGDVYYNNTLDESSAETVSVADGATVQGIDADFASTLSISGTATATDGTGINDLTVTAQGYQGDTYTTSTNSAGVYSFAGLPVDPYTIEFTDPTGVLPTTYYSAGSVLGSTTQGTTLEAASGPQTADIQFQVPTTLTVNVANKAGSALKSVDVFAYPIEHGAANFHDALTATPVSGSAGSYQFTTMTQGTSYALYFNPEGSSLTGTYPQYLGGSDLASQSQTFTPTQSTSTLSVTLAANTSVSGTVDTTAGKTLAGAAVGLWEYDGSTWQQVNGTRTGSKGTYSFPNVATGSYTVQFVTEESEGAGTAYLDSFAGGQTSYEGAVPMTNQVATAYVSPGKPAVLNGKLALGGTLSGLVESSTGSKLGGLTVIAMPLTTSSDGTTITGTKPSQVVYGVSDKNGKYTIDGLPTGIYALSFPFDDPYADSFTDPIGNPAAQYYVVTAGTTTVVSSPSMLQKSSSINTATETFTLDTSAVASPDFDPSSSITITDSAGDYVGSAPINSDLSTFTAQLTPGVAYRYTLYLVDANNPNAYFTNTTGTFTADGSGVTIPVTSAVPLAFTNPSAIAVNGSATSVGSSYSVTGATANRAGVTPTYQWYRNGHAIRGATEGTYTSQGSDFGQALTVRVSLEDFTYGQEDVDQTLPVVSNVTVGATITNLNAPSIDAVTSVKVGVALHANAGVWSIPSATSTDSNGATYHYDWTSTVGSSGAVQVGKDSPIYTPTVADLDSTLSVSVTATEVGYGGSAAVASAASVIVITKDAPTLKTAPKVSLKNGTYTVTPGTWSVAGTTPSYQWYENGQQEDSDGTSSNHHGPSYTPTSLTDSVTVTVFANLTSAGYASGRTTVVARKASGSQSLPSSTQPPTTDSVVGSFDSSVNPGTQTSVPLGSTLTAPGTAFVFADGSTSTSVSYQWYRGNTPIKGATKSTYVVATADVGAVLTVNETASNAANVGVPGFPFNAGLGELRQDLVLNPAHVSASTANTNAALTPITDVVGAWGSTTSGTITSGVTNTYQWFTTNSTGGSPVLITGATKVSYTPPASAAGNYVQLVVTGKKTGYASATTTGPVTPVGTLTPAPTTKPSITTATGSFTANPGTWPSAQAGSDSYQWFVDGNADTSDSFATTNVWTRTSADSGKEISVQITHSPTSNTYSAVTTILIAQKGAVPVAGNSTLTPTAPSFGQTLSVSTDPKINFDYPANPSLSVSQTYQWQSASSLTATPKAISGATTSSFTPTASYAGKFLSVKVSTSSDGYASATRTMSETVALVAGVAPHGTITVTTPTTVSPGATVTVNYGSGFPAGVTHTIAWQVSANGTSNWSSVSKATKTTYVIPATYLGEYLRAEVTTTKSGYATATDDSTAAVIVPPTQLIALTVPSITGGSAVGSVLTANTGLWNVAATTFAYQWYRNGGVIPGATASTFTMPGDALGDDVGVEVTASAAGYYPVTTQTNTIIVTVGAAPTATTTAKVSGTASVGSKLTATTGVWSLDDLAFSYQWWDITTGSVPTTTIISGATQATYVVQSADSGSKVFVVVTATRAGYVAGTSTSSVTSTIT